MSGARQLSPHDRMTVDLVPILVGGMSAEPCVQLVRGLEESGHPSAGIVRWVIDGLSRRQTARCSISSTANALGYGVLKGKVTNG